MLDKKLDRKQKDELLSRTVPSRQKQAVRNTCRAAAPARCSATPPDAHADRREGWVESEETVRDLVDWREEAIY